jgi:peptide-methionine (S)-S-oxide reductase
MIIATNTNIRSAMNTNHKLEQAYFAAGCFWKVQYVFSKVPGVVRTEAGYTGGHLPDPTYKDVCSDETGHAETVLVEYDPERVSYRKLLQVFWESHDPTTVNRQGPDTGTQYRSVIFYTTPEQKAEALSYKKELEASHRFNRPIVTEIEPAEKFYQAEEYHQNYYEKHGQVCY